MSGQKNRHRKTSL